MTNEDLMINLGMEISVMRNENRKKLEIEIFVCGSDENSESNLVFRWFCFLCQFCSVEKSVDFVYNKNKMFFFYLFASQLITSRACLNKFIMRRLAIMFSSAGKKYNRLIDD